MRVFSAITSLIFLVCWVLLIVSFATPFWHLDAKNRDGDYKRVLSLYPTKAKISNLGINDGTIKYSEFNDFLSAGRDAEWHYKSYIDAGLAFSVLAWVFVTIQLVLQAIDTLGKDFIPIVGKFLGFLVFVFALVSFCVYTGFRKQLHKDCTSTFSDCDSTDNGIYRSGFFGKSDNSRYGSSAGWNCILVSAILSLIASVFNVVFFNKNTAS